MDDLIRCIPETRCRKQWPGRATGDTEANSLEASEEKMCNVLSLQSVQPNVVMFSTVAVIHTESYPSTTQRVCHYDQRGVCVCEREEGG